MKKVLALLLAVMMVIGMTTASLAAEQTGNPTNGNQTMPADQRNTVKIEKIYTATNSGTTSPQEKVNFTWEKTSVADQAVGITKDNMPDLVSVTLAEYAQGAATTEGFHSYLEVVLPPYSGVGVYTYTITETNGNKAGVTYGAESTGTPIKLVVTVSQGPTGLLEIAAIHTEGDGTTKTDSFTNTYSAGSLVITKNVGGNMGDRTQYFDIKVTLNAGSKTVGAPITISGGSNAENVDTIAAGWTGEKEVTLKFKHGDTITLSNIPYGVTYKVEEPNPLDYSKEGEVTTATAINAATQSATITNTKTKSVDTGIFLDTLPYVLIVVGVSAAVVMMVAKKRRVED